MCSTFTSWLLPTGVKKPGRSRQARPQAAPDVGDPPLDVRPDRGALLGVDGRFPRVLAELADGERRAIELAYFGGLTYQQAAARLGAPELPRVHPGEIGPGVAQAARHFRRMVHHIDLLHSDIKQDFYCFLNVLLSHFLMLF